MSRQEIEAEETVAYRIVLGIVKVEVTVRKYIMRM